MAIRARSGAPRREGGAAAVEFALVLPLLLLLIFGIIDYGMFFFDSIGMRQGAREAARSAVVLRVDATACGSTISYDNIACTARTGSNNILGKAAGAVTGGGPAQVKVYMKLQTNGSNAAGWVQGNQFVMCTQVAEKPATGFVPFPANGIMTSKVVMSIESAASAPSGSLVTDAAPAGGDWTWC
ncbi:TadE family protein [Phycicoccus duodecadis]|nr:TadE/TadG family type IV pilus assembly protein [Phycicoccus duodecadis]